MSNDRNFEPIRTSINSQSSLRRNKQRIKRRIKRGVDLIKSGVDFFDAADATNEDAYVSDYNSTEEVSTDTTRCYRNDSNVFPQQERKFPVAADCDFKPLNFTNELNECDEKMEAAISILACSAMESKEEPIELPIIERRVSPIIEQRVLPIPANEPPSRSLSRVGKRHQELMSNLLSSMEKTETTRAQVQKLDITLAKKAISLKKKKQKFDKGSKLVTTLTTE